MDGWMVEWMDKKWWMDGWLDPREAVRPPVADGHIYRFDPTIGTWTELSGAGSAPSPRYGMGFTATPDGMLYVFGGDNGSNRGGRGGPRGNVQRGQR